MGAGADILFSTYVIDGVEMDTTPAAMLKECVPQYLWEKFVNQWNAGEKEQEVKTIVDEAADRTPEAFRYEPTQIADYIKLVREKLDSTYNDYGQVNKFHPGFSTRIIVATSVLQSLWDKAHTNLERLRLSATWTWDTVPLGNMAMFFASVEAATGYVYELGVHINRLQFNFAEEWHSVRLDILPPVGKVESPASQIGSSSDKCHFCNDKSSFSASNESDSCITNANPKAKSVPDNITNLEGTRLIYIPFDTCSHKLGGSVLGEILGGDEASPEISDPDYFIDCYEIIKELAEDGVVLSGVSVGRGGLVMAVDKILGDNAAIDLDISGIEQAYLEPDPVRILFAEIPGVLIQIKATDSDYADSQFLLQDIAYYPVGIPVKSDKTGEKIRLASDKRTELANILAALMSSRSSEGED